MELRVLISYFHLFGSNSLILDYTKLRKKIFKGYKGNSFWLSLLFFWRVENSIRIPPSFLNQRRGFVQLSFGYDQRRWESDDILLSWLCDYSFIKHLFRKFISEFVRVEFDTDEQSFPADLFYLTSLQNLTEIFLEDLSKSCGIFAHFFFQEDV